MVAAMDTDEHTAELEDRPHGPATDPHATTEADDGQAGEHWGWDHRMCITYCLEPGQRRRGPRCPACYGPVTIRPIGSEDIEPGMTRAERFAAWLGSIVAAFVEALIFPFRVGRAHTEAMIRDLLQEAMAAGLSAEVDGLDDILTVLEAIERELQHIGNVAGAAGAGER